MPKVGRTVQVACGLGSRRMPCIRLAGSAFPRSNTMPVAAGDALLIYDFHPVEDCRTEKGGALRIAINRTLSRVGLRC